MKSDILLTLIKEVVKNEVKQQVKEEIAKLIKSGRITLNNSTGTSVKKMIPVSESFKPKQSVTKTEQPQFKQPVKQITKNPMINEILNQTTPFSASERVEGGATGGSILDAIQPNVSMEGDWETMDYRGTEIPQQQIPTADNAGVDALTKALSRDYSELVKRFK
jgi:hypothetical protein